MVYDRRLLGYAEERVWNSFFLQYLWEFCLGMKMAEIYHGNPKALEVPRWKCLFAVVYGRCGVDRHNGLCGVAMETLQWYTSLMGYMSLALIIYKVGIKPLNRLLEWTNRFSYEWYLVHMFVFDIIFYCIGYKRRLSWYSCCVCFCHIVTAIAYSKYGAK